MANYSATIQRVMDELGRLPGIGARTAERLTFFLLKAGVDDAMGLSDAIRDLKTKIRPCRLCFNPTEDEFCAVCADSRRERATICVVEQPKDLLSLESTGAFGGVYHVLMGHIAPLDNVGPEDLTLDALLGRVRTGQPDIETGELTPITEVILATNPTVAGDATALFIQEMLAETGVNVSRLARGLPAGGQIEYASQTILADAINERKKL